MIQFEFLTGIVIAAGLIGFFWAVLRERDVFHPLAYLMPMVLFMYAYLPAELIQSNLLTESGYSEQQLVTAQLLNAGCVVAVLLGCLWGGRAVPATSLVLDVAQVSRVFSIAMVLGVVSLAAFSVVLGNVGGLFEAYSQEKGGGTADSGYTRDAVFWSVAAVATLTACFRYGLPRPAYWFAAIVFGAPMLIHGLLGARRGPTFIGVAVLAAMYYLGRDKRPRLPFFIAGGAGLGLCLLLIVNFREEFRLGSDLMNAPAAALDSMMGGLQSQRRDVMERTLGANEFVYGVDVITRFSSDSDPVYWGRRLLTIIFIRPIPSQLWPNKYVDVGMERYLINVGLGGVDEFSQVANGAAPGFAADLFAEFSWGAILASFAIGWGYARVWRLTKSRGGMWLCVYPLLIAFSIFLVTQSIEAIVYRLLFCAAPVLLLWVTLVRGSSSEVGSVRPRHANQAHWQ